MNRLVNRERGVAVLPVSFRLLGDLQAWADDRPIELGHVRQRCVLAVLLIDANRHVSPDRLVERVWGDRVPQRERGVLYTYLSRLRRALAPATDVTIVRRPEGYLLAVDPVAVDLHRFRQLVARAHAAGADEEALALLEEALGLFRGDAFAALDTPWLSAVREDVGRQRRAAESDRNDLALRVGQHARILTGLSLEAELQPLDERLAAQLMLALYRSGRPADALATYRRVRLRLADELGTDPSPPLRHLHHRILMADPALALPTATRSPRSPGDTGVPRQLPAPPRTFAGRVSPLARLDALLGRAGDRRPAAVVILSGGAGVGKSALAVHWAQRAAAHFPDGQLYVDLRGFDPSGNAMNPAEALNGFLAALRVPAARIPAGLDAQAALYRGELADKRVLIVLDNARDAGQVRPLLPGTTGCLVLVSSRNRLTSLVTRDAADPVALDALSTGEARALLAGRLGAQRVTAEPDAVDDIIAACARLPLALAVVAGRGATHPGLPLRDLAEELHSAGEPLDALAETDPTTDVRGVFSWSYRLLSPGASRLFRLLGLHPGPDFAIGAAAGVAGVPVPRARTLLAELMEVGLVTEYVAGRYRLHDLLRAYAIEMTHAHDTEPDRRLAVHRVLDHYLHTAHHADRLLGPRPDPLVLPAPPPETTVLTFSGPAAASAWFGAERAVLCAAVDQAADAGFDRHAWQLAWTLTTFLQRRGAWHEWIATQHVGLAAGRRLGDRTAEACAHRLLGAAFARLGRADDAGSHLRSALELYGELGDHVNESRIHLVLAWLLDDHDRAAMLDHVRQAVAPHRPLRPPVGPSDALDPACPGHPPVDEHRRVLEPYREAVALLQASADRSSQAVAWLSMGMAQHRIGHHPQAAACLRYALDLFHEMGDRYLEADTLHHLAGTELAAGRPDAARRAWRRAFEILSDLQHPDAARIQAELSRT